MRGLSKRIVAGTAATLTGGTALAIGSIFVFSAPALATCNPANTGTAGNDTITCDAANNPAGATVDGLAGNDLINLNTGASAGNVRGGDGDDVITVDGASVSDVEGEGDNDTINLLSGVFGAHRDVRGGAGHDFISLNGADVDGSIFGDGGNDQIELLSGSASFIRGNEGNDRITLNGTARTATILGGGGNDLILLQSGEALGVFGDEGNDQITLSGATITDDILAGGGNDLITFTSGTAPSLDAGAGNDAFRLQGGGINSVVSASANPGIVNLGGGNDQLIIDDAADATASLDILGVTIFNGGDGAGDIASIAGTASLGLPGSFENKTLTSWGNVTFDGGFNELDGVQTIDNLMMTNASRLVQRDGALTIQDQSGGTGSTLSVDGTSDVRMDDGAADDSITAGNVSLAPGASIAADVDPAAGTSDVINVVAGGTITSVSTSISLTQIGGSPALTGSIPVVDNLGGFDPATPSPGDMLTPSAAYNLLTPLSTPLRTFALVDETAGGGGVFLQWTTNLNTTTTGANAVATQAVNNAVFRTLGATANAINFSQPGGAGRRIFETDCGVDGNRAWGQYLFDRSALDQVSGFAGYDSETSGFVAGFDADLGALTGECGNSRAGIFGFFANSRIAIHDDTGSSADGDTYGGGGYASVSFGDLGLSLIGIAGFSNTGLVNGILTSTADIDQFGYGGQAAASYTPQLDDQVSLDFRIFGQGVWGDIDSYTDSLGVAFSSSSAESLRVGGTAGFTFTGRSGDVVSSLYANAGAARQNVSSTSSSNGINATYEFDETVMLVNAGVTISPNEAITIFAGLAGEWGDKTENYAVRAGFSLKLR